MSEWMVHHTSIPGVASTCFFTLQVTDSLPTWLRCEGQVNTNQTPCQISIITDHRKSLQLPAGLACLTLSLFVQHTTDGAIWVARLL